jgi:POT family proton-dependent oligopeptide transporter
MARTGAAKDTLDVALEAGSASDCRRDHPLLFGHPKALWLLFMTEFWERFAFYGIRWALTLYIVAQFHRGDAAAQGSASRTYGAYLAIVYGTAIFGGYIADRLIGGQRSILAGAIVMAAGLFVIMVPNEQFFLFGLSVITVGNGLFKPNISSLVGQLYAPGDPRRDRGFTIFYMGINAGGFVAPMLTGWLASAITRTSMQANYKLVFGAAGTGMLLSLAWFWIGRSQLCSLGAPPPECNQRQASSYVAVSAAALVCFVYGMLTQDGAVGLAWLLGLIFIGVSACLLWQGWRMGRVARDRVASMLLLFCFNVIFFMFFEQAGSSFTFLAQNIVDRHLFGGAFVFPTAWFQSVNTGAILLLAPIVAGAWAVLGMLKMEPSIPRKFGLGLLGNALGFLALMFALTHLVDANNSIPIWPLVLCYVLQTIGELCLSPIGLSMVTKLAPAGNVSLAMGGWFLSTAIGNNLSGLVAGQISGAGGMTIASALSGFTFSFWLLAIAGLVLLAISPPVDKLMHGVK